MNHGGYGTTQLGSNRTVKRASGMRQYAAVLCAQVIKGKQVTSQACRTTAVSSW